jgi:glycosyltransferase involved in cell wall biosynthesis
MNNITVIILTKNEEVNILQALNSTRQFADEVLILDSHSTDRTAQICREAGAIVFTRCFDNYAAQRNYAIQSLPVKTDWIMFLDADEFLTEELKEEILNVLPASTVNGYYIKRRFYFMGKWIRWGGYYPTWILRLFKKDKGIYHRSINEHVVVEGPTAKLQFDFADRNHKSFFEWWNKHIYYAKCEARDLYENNKLHKEFHFFGGQAARKSWIRYKVWNRFPLLVRPFVYFIYRYFFRFGILDGRKGFVFHFMHALVYFLLIDIFYLEMKIKQDS